MSEPAFRSGVSRRHFLGMSGAVLALVAGGEAYGLGREVVAQEEAWRAAAADNDDFLDSHYRALRNVTIGASFAPEQWAAEAQVRKEPLAALDWAVSELGMRQIRLGLRWSRVEPSEGKLDLGPYRPYLDYAFDRRLDLCLNVGPVRTFRWPEEHVPAWLAQQIDLPPEKATVSANSELALRARDYLGRLIDALKAEYGHGRVSSIPIVQLENEPFYPLGRHEWELGRGYLKALLRQADQHFPASRLLLTTAARLNLAQVRGVFADLMEESPRFGGRFAMGFDYHYKTPLRDSIPLVRYLDPIAFARLGQESCGENREMARLLRYGIEVSEGQAEPYRHLTAPGNSARHFRFMVLRCAQSVLLPEEPSVIRVWGTEELAKKALSGQATDEHRAIFDLVRRINGASPASPPAHAPAGSSRP